MSPPLWFANFLSYCLQIVLLAMVGTALPALFRLRAPRVLLAYWQGLLVICLALPVLQPWKSLAAVPSAAEGTVSISFASVPAGAAGVHSWLYPLIIGGVLAGMLLRMAWLGLGLGRLRAIRRAAYGLDPLPRGVRELQARLHVSPSWYVSPEMESPATFGIRPPSILLPERFPKWSEAFQRAIAGHELLHVARRHWILNLAEEFILTVFWFHPAVAWVVHRIRLSREQTVDAEVVRLYSARKPYLSALLEIASGGPGPALGAAPTFLKERQLAHRIELLVKEVTMSKARLFLSLTAIVGLLTLAGVVSVWAFPLLAPAQDASADVRLSDSENVHAHLQLIKRVVPVYPVEAKKAGIQGMVVLRVTIEKDGSVSNLKVVRGNPELAKAALDAVRQWRYAPSEKALITEVDINFTLADGGSHGRDEGAGVSGGVAGGVNGGVAGGVSTGTKEEVYSVGNGVSAPIPIYKPEPPYTKEAKAAKVQGKVDLLVTIGADGAVSDVKVENGFDKGLTQNAVDTVKTWKFKPAMKDGKAVSCKVSIEVNFKLY